MDAVTFAMGIVLIGLMILMVLRSLWRLEAEVKQVAKQLYGWRVEQRGSVRGTGEQPVPPRIPGGGD